MSPILEKWDGINAVRLYFGKVVAYIKVDRRPFPEHLRKAVLGKQPFAVQIARELEKSKDLAAMKKIATGALGARA
jgi:hypothetical protein